MGLLPGIVEETLLALRRRQPVYVAGGFGGAARLVAQAIRGKKPEALTLDYQTKVSPAYGEMLRVYDGERAKDPTLPRVDYDGVVVELEGCGVKGLAERNGLSEAENLELLEAGSVDAALYLIMKGLAGSKGAPPSR
jgi:SLOG cluster2